MAGKKTKSVKVEFANTPAERMRRVWLAGLGAFSLTRKHGGQWFGRFAEEGQDLAGRGLQLARETFEDTRAHAVGIVSPITARVEKRFDAYAAAIERGMGRTLHRLGIPTKREIEELTRQVAALSRKLKAAK